MNMLETAEISNVKTFAGMIKVRLLVLKKKIRVGLLHNAKKGKS